MERSFRFLQYNGKRALVLLITTFLLLATTVGATVAILIAKSESAQNTFTPPVLRIRLEGYDDVVNEGNLPVYVRALAVANWVSTEDERAILPEAPVVGEDLTIEFYKEGWFAGADGFYYYKKPLDAGEGVALIKHAYQIKEKEGYELRLELLSSAIQAYPAEAVSVAWPAVFIDENGELQSAIATAEEEQ